MSGKAPRIDWRRAATQALLSATLHVVVFNPGFFVWLSIQRPWVAPALVAIMVGTWCMFALVLAVSAQGVEGRWPWAAIVALGLVDCAFITYQLDLNRGVQSWLHLPITEQVVVSRAWFAWVSVVAGAPFFWYCLVVQRSVRVRGLLGRAQFERSRTASLIDRAQADAVEGRIDPALLQRALAALQAAYAQDRTKAEALLEALVDFLRQAMPAIRSGRSSLMHELTLLRRYAVLVQLVDGGRHLCRLSVDPVPHDPPLAPLLLVPLVEALARADAAAAPPRVTLTVEGAALKLAFDATPSEGWLDPVLAQRLARALPATASAAGARYLVGGSRALTLWLPLPPTREEVSHERSIASPA